MAIRKIEIEKTRPTDYRFTSVADKFPRADLSKLCVFCDGVYVPLCTEASVAHGEAWGFDPDPDGKPYLNGSRTEIVKKLYRGKIEIRELVSD